MSEKVEIYCDGACRGNPGPGGWGALLRCNGHEKRLYGSEPLTTNNRMELQAAIAGLAALKRPCHVSITTDSKYVQQGMTEWLANWKKRGWKSASRQPVKNVDLWMELDQQSSRHLRVDWHWIKGHSGHAENELADQLANQAIDELLGGGANKKVQGEAR
ncbi:MAG: ribonuclease HI [Pseudomonadales bacterium]|jgi:ribonuclease HI|nr:ribonuclease HI [Pseudomonadales bacterium]MCC6529123.1 ribonuclease HI [Pseudomonadales bacterium]MCP5332429.1 ribonuclease HI [Pseudomonadales bacterium]HMU90645.1 ribonuclease HI [Pseudomonadales bacterium]HMW15478.1 ribonuclease HI [Pseudomonadales bacterium]